MERLDFKQEAWGCWNKSEQPISIVLPCPDSELMPGIRWGHAADLFTPAFWKYQSYMRRLRNDVWSHRLGDGLLEEVAVCLLGGFGMPAEIGLEAYRRLKAQQLLNGDASAEEIEKSLSTPLIVNGRSRKYRFPKQKAKYLSSALSSISQSSIPSDARSLRDYLMTLNGIGPKTASWVVRNYLGADDVAILDVHIIRAGQQFGLFGSDASPGRGYQTLERLFLDFCDAISEPASLVDAIMWDQMRRLWRGSTHQAGSLNLSPRLS